jgi:hypothetical protein
VTSFDLADSIGFNRQWVFGVFQDDERAFVVIARWLPILLGIAGSDEGDRKKAQESSQ